MTRAIVVASVLWLGCLRGLVYSETSTEEKLRNVVSQLARQMVLQEFQAQERIRMEGDSGIVQVKNYETGDFNYQSFSHVGETVGSMHDHAGSNDTLGYGMLTAVLKGVEFTTRHNDPRLFMPSTTSTEWHKTEPVPFPDVPPSVLAKDTVEKQVEEMQEYFRAFKNQDTNIRDFQQYFKPVLCYLEGAWLSDITTLEQPFESMEYRYFKAWTNKDLKEQARLVSYLGSDLSPWQRVANLPRTIIGFNETTIEAILAQWEYRILCHPVALDSYLGTGSFKIKEAYEYKERYPDSEFKDQKYYSRGTLFTLHEENEQSEESLLDRIIRKVPGKDNIPEELWEGKYVQQQPKDISNNNLNVSGGFYNRVYHIGTKDFMRRTEHIRGYADDHLYMALTTQQEVAPLPISFSYSKWDHENFNDLRASWMIPLEIVYLTPLLKWNPYDIYVFTSEPQQDPARAATRRAGTEADPQIGISSERFYQTPITFYTHNKHWVEERVAADDFSSSRYVQDQEGVNRLVIPSGTFTVTPHIGNNVGHCRLRFPIFPVHFEGNSIWKEFNAFRAHVSDRIQQLSTTLR